MTSIRFLHAADIHLDSPFKGLSHIPEKLSKVIRQSTFKAFDRIIQACIEQEADFLLISGDVYDIEDMSLRAQLHFYNGVSRLHEFGIRTFVIHGNHDPLVKEKTSIHWPESVYFFSEKEVEVVDFIKNDTLACRIYGRSYPKKDFKENLVAHFQVMDKEVFNIGLLHSNVDGNKDHDPYAPSKLQDLLQSDIDYWALGHIHKGQILSENNPVIAYSGNPQGRHMKETGSKGCLLVHVNNHSVSSLEWINTSEIIWEVIDLDISATDSITNIMEIIHQHINQLISKYRLPIILRINLEGKTNLHFSLRDKNGLMDMQEAINQAYIHEENWAFIDDIILLTKPNITIEQMMEQETFIADFVKGLNEEMNSGEASNNMKKLIDELLANRGLRKHLIPLSEQAYDKLYNDVLNIAIDFFVEEENS